MVKTIKKINLSEKAHQIETYWDPKIIGRVNQMVTKVARIKGSFTWHHHQEEDELFYVIEGQLLIQLPDQEILLNQGEMIIIPRGVQHRPVAEQDCLILLFESENTLNTGNVVNQFTKTIADEI